VTVLAGDGTEAGPTTGARFFIATLGCPKNEADSDRLSAAFRAAGHLPASLKRADLIIVNTCGFIDAAIEESIDAVLEAAEAARRSGARVAMYGCLVARYRRELERELPEVDLFCEFDHAPVIALLDELAARHAGPLAAGNRRVRSRAPAPLHSFLKISDGCDQRCAFCAIPLIKGSYEIVSPGEILAAAERALASGARELVLVGQDTSRWSWPAYGGLSRLLADLKRLGALWVRLLYLQPQGVDEALLDAVAEHALPYLDLPLQHADAGVLRRMGRSGDARRFLALLDRIRDRIPQAAVRSTFLVGHPGESEQAFERLEEFVREAGLAVAGVFVFDPQEGTRSAACSDRVPTTVAEQRAARLAEAIETAGRAFWDGLTGQELDVLIESGTRDPDGEAVGRIPYQAPDVDGQTFVTGRAARRGTLVRARIVAATGFDLHGQAR